jgi:hypothetical protein
LNEVCRQTAVTGYSLHFSLESLKEREHSAEVFVEQKMDLNEIVRIDVVQNRDRCWALVNTVMNARKVRDL